MRRLSRKKPPVARGCARRVEAVTPTSPRIKTAARVAPVGLGKSLFVNRNYLAITRSAVIGAYLLIPQTVRREIMALFSADDITYPPLDVPKPVADGVWIVDSGPLRVFGLLGLPIRMTALQLSSGDMLMHSPTRFDTRLKAEIEAHGPPGGALPRSRRSRPCRSPSGRKLPRAVFWATRWPGR